MAYGEIKVDTVTFTDGGIDKSVSISGLVQNPTFSGNITVTGTISGNTVQGQTVSGATITGNAAAFTTVTGGTATITSGVFASGTAGAPSVSVGTTDNGIYSPGTDQVAVATNGVGRLFVDASGNVGVGSSSVATYTGQTYLSVDHTTGGVGIAGINLATNGNRNAYLITYPGNSEALRIASESATLPITVYTNNSERLRITSAGLVGIGTSSVNALLEVNNSTAGGEVQRIEGNYSGSGSVILTNWRRAGGSVAAALKYNDDSSPLCMSIGTTTSHEFRIRTADTDAITIDTSQRVGIGTSTPGANLEVFGDTADVVLTSVTNNNATGANKSLNCGVGGATAFSVPPWPNSGFIDSATTNGLALGSSSSTGSVRLYTGTSREERLRITSAGNVGIGTTSPGAKLDVVGNARVRGSATPTLTFNDGAIENNLSITNSAFVLSVPSANPITFNTTNTERLRITSAGLVGIGTSSPDSYKDEAEQLVVAKAGNCGITVASANNGVGALYFADGTSGSDASRGGLYYSHIDNSMQLLADGSARVHITSAGNVGIGTTSPGNTLHLSGTNGVGIRIENTSNSISAYSTLESSGGLQANISGSGFFSWVTGGGEKVRIDNSGRLLVGTSTSVSNVYIASSAFQQTVQVATATNSYANGFTALNYSASGYAPVLTLGLSKNNTLGSDTAISSGDDLGVINFVGNDGTNFRTGAFITATCDGAVSTGDLPTRLVFSTTADGASSPTERLRITSAGLVGIGTTTPISKLEVDGDIRSAGRGTSFGFILPDWRVYNSSGGNALVIDNYTTEALRVDSSNRLLVGTSSVISNGYGGTSGLFQVAKNDFVPIGFFTYTSAGADGYCPYLELNRARGTQASPSAVLSGDELGEINFYGHDGSTFIRGASIRSYVDGTPGAGDMPGRLVFSTTADGASSPTGRAQIDYAGRFYTFVAAATDGPAFMSAEGAGTVYQLFAGWRSTSNVSGASAQLVFQVFTNGNTQNTNNSYAGISDLKLKENVVDAGSQWSDIKELRVRKYNFKEKTGHETHTQIGLIAQEAELVSPGLVIESPDRNAEGKILGTITKSVNYSVLYMKAVKALQEAMERIENLEASNADLLARVSALESA
jgi:hypothetical protein